MQMSERSPFFRIFIVYQSCSSKLSVNSSRRTTPSLSNLSGCRYVKSWLLRPSASFRLALGDVPNIAARMESLSPTNGMAITPEIKDAVEHKFVCKPLVIDGKSSHFVKGIKEAIAVFTIDSHKNAGAGAESVMSPFASESAITTWTAGI